MGTSKITETSRLTNGNWLILVAPCTCPGCGRCSSRCQNLTDVPDGLCASCRAWRASDDLVEDVWNALENFFDARYQPNDGFGNYYSDVPAPEFGLAYEQILDAIDETCAGIKTLVELALQRRVEMHYPLTPMGFWGIAFRIEWEEIPFSFFPLTSPVTPPGFTVDLEAEAALNAATLELREELREEDEQ